MSAEPCLKAKGAVLGGYQDVEGSSRSIAEPDIRDIRFIVLAVGIWKDEFT